MSEQPEKRTAEAEEAERKMNLATTVILLALFFGLMGFGVWSCVRVVNQSQFM